MKVVLFCGGLGLRIRDASQTLPKPLITVGNRPILWHVMQYYAHYGHRDFVLCLGHNGQAIKDYFRDNGELREWNITLAETGVDSNIGQRLSMVRPHLDGDEIFLCNYADGLTDLHLPALVDAFAASGKVGALLCTRPTLSYHFMQTDPDGTVIEMEEPQHVALWVNGGYFVFRREIFDYIHDGEDLVGEPFRRLIRDRRLFGYRHDGFWRNMDTFKDKQALDDLHASGAAPWEVWRRSPRPARE
jgi:glucose-1-phosphate cytidylyltransferase